MDALKRPRKSTMVDDEPHKISPKKMKKDIGDIENIFEDSNDDWCFERFQEKENLSQNQNSPKKAANQFSLDLKNWKRCLVDSVQRDKNFDLILEVVDGAGNARAVCRLQGAWAHSRINENQVVSLKAIWSSKYECYIVNHENGMIVTDPDLLISGTTVVGSLFCKRKCILQEKFRGIDSDSKIMITGVVVHELLQTVLKNKLKSLPEIVKASEELISSPNMIFTLYSSKMTVEEIQDEMKIFIPRISDFVQKYVLGKRNNTSKDEFQGCITDIEDIEQNLWVPRLGLKGKIDVSARVRPSMKTMSKSKLMPLELKTGKPSFSSEHKGQVTLYQLMLEELNEDVDSGLLLYLRDGIMKEVKSSRNEKRDLIMLRNEVAHYLANGTTISSKSGLSSNSSKTTGIDTLRLPEPINHHSACGKCPYNTICTTFLTRSSEEQLSENHPLKKISSTVTIHLKPEHINYFIHWCSILALEEHEEKKLNLTKDIWTEKTEKRVKSRRTIDDLVISGNVSFVDGRYTHTFKNTTNNENKTDFTLSKIQVGEYVLVSCGDRINVAAGHIQDLTPSTITISVERDLSKKYPSQRFIVDKHFSTSGHVFNFTNLGVLLEYTEDSQRLRKIIIEKETPIFSGFLPKIIANEGVDILADLNVVQRKAVLKALTTNQYMLIKGLPGTGKTQTIVAIIRLLDLMGKSIIITSHTHSAVDNVLLRLKNHGVKFLRLGSDLKIHPSLHEHSESKITASCKTVEELSAIYSSYSIVGVTCLGSAHSLFMHKKFDICIVDEASQVFQPTILRPLLYAKKFILVGDPDQLPPVIRSKEAKDLGADESLFQRLDTAEATSILTVQYRMNRGITKLANDLIYQGSLECANDDIRLASLHGLKLQKLVDNYKNQKWILRVLQKHVDFSTMFLDTEDCLERSTEFSENKYQNLTQVIQRSFSEEEEVEEKKDVKFQCINYCEAAIAFTLVKALLISGFSAKNIGIIAPYRAQVELLKKLLENLQENEKLFDGLEINTVDQFQGRDKDVIIYSCTRTGAFTSAGKSKNNILEDRRRITVAITRSKHKLIIVGDQKCLVQFTPFRDLYEKIPSRCKITLKSNEQGFSWDSVFSILNNVFHSS